MKIQLLLTNYLYLHLLNQRLATCSLNAFTAGFMPIVHIQLGLSRDRVTHVENWVRKHGNKSQGTPLLLPRYESQSQISPHTSGPTFVFICQTESNGPCPDFWLQQDSSEQCQRKLASHSSCPSRCYLTFGVGQVGCG